MAIKTIVINKGLKGDVGPAGATGADGADGNSVLNGSGAPSSMLGNNGDFYIDTDVYDIYGPKTAGAWGSPTSLSGSGGSPGGADTDVQFNDNGSFGGDSGFTYDGAGSVTLSSKLSAGSMLVGGAAQIGSSPLIVRFNPGSQQGVYMFAGLNPGDPGFGIESDGSSVTFQGTNAGLAGAVPLRLQGSGDLYLGPVLWPSADGTDGQVLSTNGAGVLDWIDAGGGSGANTSLSNLTSPTAINQNLIFDEAADYIISVQDSTVQARHLTIKAGSKTTTGASGGDLTLQAGGAFRFGGNVNVKGGDGLGTSFGAGRVNITGGEATNGAAAGGVVIVGGISSDPAKNGGNVSISGGLTVDGIGGNLELTIPPPSGSGSRGQLRILDGSQGTAGYVWTSTDTLGSGTWAPASGGGGSPGGSDGYVQFNDSGTFGGEGTLFWDAATDRLGVGTGAPLERLHVSGGSGTGSILIEGSANNFAHLDGLNAVMIDSNGSGRIVTPDSQNLGLYPGKALNTMFTAGGSVLINNSDGATNSERLIVQGVNNTPVIQVRGTDTDSGGIYFYSLGTGETASGQIDGVFANPFLGNCALHVQNNSTPLRLGNATGLTDLKATNIRFSSYGAGTLTTDGSGNITAVPGGGSGVTTMAPIGSSPNADGATISGSTLTLQPASASFGGIVTDSVQDFTGQKTWYFPVGNGAYFLSGTDNVHPGVVIGSNGPGGDVSFQGMMGDKSTPCPMVINATTLGLGADTALTLKTAGNPAISISSSQLLRFNAYGAGTLQTDASGNVTAVAAGGGANSTLSNLTSPTAINEDLILTGTKTLRLRNDVTITGRNAADDADVGMIKVGDDNFVWIGDDTKTNIHVRPDQSFISLHTENNVGGAELEAASLDLFAGDGAGSAQTEIIFWDGIWNNGVGLKAPDLATETYTLKLPPADGDPGDVLSTDGSGNLSFIPAGGGSGVTTMAPVGGSPNADGATISGSTLTLQPADLSNPGVMTVGTQSFNGAKAFFTNGAGVVIAGNGATTAFQGILTDLMTPAGIAIVGSETGLNTNSGSVTLATVGVTGITLASTTNLVRFHAYGAGTLTTDASGNITATSDERLKDIEAPFSKGLSAIKAIEPIMFKWKNNDPSGVSYAGFGAGNVQAAIPEAVGRMANGDLTLQDRAIIATLVNAVKELSKKVEELEAIK